MIYRKIAPPPALAEVVKFFWILEGRGADNTPLLYRLFADGCPGLLVQYGNRFGEYTPDGRLEPVATCFYHGQTSAHSDTAVTGAFGLIGVYLYPYATTLLTGIPARELTGRTLDARLLFGGRVRDVEERVQAAATAQERVTVLADFLADCLRRTTATRHPGVEQCLRNVLLHRSGVRVDDTARLLGMSARQLERKFLDTVGLPPKLFARIIRFQGTLLAAAEPRIGTLTELAYACGYSDQSHFIRDFREFSGMNPRRYFSRLEDAAESLVLLPD